MSEDTRLDRVFDAGSPTQGFGHAAVGGLPQLAGFVAEVS
jgi:hypothetical protein